VISTGPRSKPASLSVFEEYIYWIDLETNSIRRANKTDGSSQQTVKANVGTAKSLKAVHWSVQKGKYSLESFGKDEVAVKVN